MFALVRLVVRLVALVVVAGVLYTGVTFVQVWQASRQDNAREAGAILVLGAAQYAGRPSGVLRARLDHAADLYERGLAPVMVLTGGRRPGDEFTEAAAGARYLIDRGVPSDALLLESSGENSWQSLAASARLLRARGIREVILVSTPYHAKRIEAIAGEVGLEAHVSPTAGRSATLAELTRETAAVAVGRIIGYRRLVNLDSQVGRVRSMAPSR
jgi:uncharacterized SAM-binding protein YcdF (DUF218 family)